MTTEHVIKVAGTVCRIKRVNTKSIEINFYGRPATYWPGKSVVLRNPLDGKYLKIRSK